MGEWLLQLEPGGAGTFDETMKTIAHSRMGRGVMVVISDYMLKEGYEKGLRAVAGRAVAQARPAGRHRAHRGGLPQGGDAGGQAAGGGVSARARVAMEKKGRRGGQICFLFRKVRDLCV